MKSIQILFSVLLHHFLISGGSNNFALAQEEQVEVGADGSTVPQVNCDDVCAAKVSEVTSAAMLEQDNLHGHIRALREDLERAEQQLREAWEAKDNAINDLQRERNDMESTKQACYGEVDSLKQKVGQVEASLQASNKQSEQIAGELFEAKQGLAEYQGLKFFINTKLIKADLEKATKQLKDDVMALLKKYGILKD
jgi:chromosome segregation ATPase